jgi:hypothetical protein
MVKHWKEMTLEEATPDNAAHRWWKKFERNEFRRGHYLECCTQIMVKHWKEMSLGMANPEDAAHRWW